MNNLNHPVRDLSHLRSALYGEPWAITEAGFRLMCNILEAHARGMPPEFEAAQKQDEKKTLTFEQQYGFSFTDNDVAVIPVSGPIFPKSNLFTRLSGATSLDSVRDKLDTAMSLKPSAVIMNFDSPGGSVSGLADFCSDLHEMAQGQTPFIGLVNPLCASAAYMMASQCDMIYSVDGGLAGSIGTIARIDNWDRADRNQGNDPVVIASHELKASGHGQLTPSQMGDMQRRVKMFDSKFQEAVSRGRPQVDLSKVSTGQVWMSNPANDDDSSLELGLIDGISSLEKLIQQF